MRVAVFTDSYLPTVDGVVNSIRNTKRCLKALGHEFVVIAPGGWHDGGAHASDLFLCRAAGLRKYPGYRLALLPSRGELDYLEGLDVDLVHSHGIAFMGLKGMWAARELGVPLITTFHTNIVDAIPHYSPRRANPRTLQRLASLYIKHFLQRCSSVVTPSRAILRELQGLAPGMRRTAVIPSGVDLARFHPAVSGRRVREMWDLDGSELILYVGRVAREKGLDLLLRAYGVLRQWRPDVKLMVAGTGPFLGECMAQARRRFPWRDVIFPGFVPDALLPQFYAACDVFALPSQFETQGLVLLEAMASGRPAVGVDYRAIPEFIQPGYNGALCSPDDPGAFAGALLATLQQADELSQGARRTAEAYSLEACAEKLLTVYQELVESRDPGQGAARASPRPS